MKYIDYVFIMLCEWLVNGEGLNYKSRHIVSQDVYNIKW